MFWKYYTHMREKLQEEAVCGEITFCLLYKQEKLHSYTLKIIMVCSITRFLYLYQLLLVFIVLFPSVILWWRLYWCVTKQKILQNVIQFFTVNSFITVGPAYNEEKMQCKLLVKGDSLRYN